ncbi:MAG: Ig-like domain repeat protein [Terracidiphilus sp.]|jgi:sugar lactone lactonase YvrE
MNPMQPAKPTRTLRTFGLFGAVVGLVLLFAPQYANAQNAAQRAALARLGRAHGQTNPRPSSSGVEAINIQLSRPGGLAFDTAGDIYIADTDNYLIREVNVDGIISTVAGNGEQGFGGDGGPATSALLDSPDGVAVDSAGNIYIADTNNNRIREVQASTGNIVTIAGTGVAGFSGDGGSAVSATLDSPTAIAVDSQGNVYIADTLNNRIREITGANINTVAGNGQQTYSGDGGLAPAAGLDSPNGVAVDASFNIYIGDTHNQRVRVVTISTGIITTIAGTGVKGFTSDGPVASAELARPRGVAVDTSGNVYVADGDNDRIREVAGGNVTTIAGDGTEGNSGDAGSATGASIDTPFGLVASGKQVAFADTENNLIQIITAGTINGVGGQPVSGNESLAISGPTSTVYGTGTLTATFSNAGHTATGLVTFYDGEGANPAVVGSASLSSDTAALNTNLLAAGIHYIIASYAGDANDAPITSGVFVLVITPVQLTAVANPVSLLYGQAIPALTGTLSGVLAQDSGNVTASFTTTATITSAPGVYPIAVTLSGSAAGNYTVVLGAGSGSVTIAQAPTTTTLSSSSTLPISGTNLTLTATVASTTSGTPTGTVSFFNGAVLLNSTPATLNGGIATLTVAAPAVGSFSFVAVYSGNTDFASSSSSALTGSVVSSNFTIAATPATQTILPSQSANYTISLTPASPTFVYPVSLSASGLPATVTATFTPSSIATGAGASTSVLSLAASGQAKLNRSTRPWRSAGPYSALALILLPLMFGRRVRRTAARLSHAGRLLAAFLALAVLGAITGCGSTSGFFGNAVSTYSVTVTAVSGPNTQTTVVNLTVE